MLRSTISFQCDTHEEAQAVLAAVAAIGKEPMACSRQYVPKEELQTREAIDKVPVARKNVSPGEQMSLREMSLVERPVAATKKTSLVGARQQVKFDGDEFYV